MSANVIYRGISGVQESVSKHQNALEVNYKHTGENILKMQRYGQTRSNCFNPFHAEFLKWNNPTSLFCHCPLSY